MRDLKFILQKKYEKSWALVIGINRYENVSPLAYALNDAKEVNELLVDELGFKKENITYLVDKDATRSNILKSFLRFSLEDVRVDDRLFVFFAGHGHTRPGIRGEVGYLVPYDADTNDYSTLIRWDELTRNAELIRAKHILFVMDACYGGLAVHRDIKSGSSRFLNDMYQRYSRQVITAGKADEVVSDAGGPLPSHSVFTGHFIEGVRGKAANEYGVITASGLMAYVYSKVANEPNSEQTPHYGQFDGDGDFIISMPLLETNVDNDTKDLDSLATIPYGIEVRNSSTTDEKIDYVKEMISSEGSLIKLHDFAVSEVGRFLSSTSEDSFPVSDSYSEEVFLDRVAAYERHAKDLSAIVACLSHWAKEDQLIPLTKIISRSCDRLLEHQGGMKLWLNLRWYPLLLLTYNAGIAAVESRNYRALAKIFYIKLNTADLSKDETFFVEIVATATSGMKEAFKKIPGNERKYTPLSEYLFKLLQPGLDDLFFLGKGYEAVYDEFEVLFALAVADQKLQEDGRVWGPVGRFGWKERSYGISPFVKLRNDAARQKDDWGPLSAGMFGGSYERFEEVAEQFQSGLLSKLNWF